MSKSYHIDNVPADMKDIIDLAKQYGYDGDGGIYRTSVAAGVLRKHNHVVGNASDIKTLNEGSEQ